MVVKFYTITCDVCLLFSKKKGEQAL
jgi:hypothetical protein